MKWSGGRQLSLEMHCRCSFGVRLLSLKTCKSDEGSASLLVPFIWNDHLHRRSFYYYCVHLIYLGRGNLYLQEGIVDNLKLTSIHDDFDSLRQTWKWNLSSLQSFCCCYLSLFFWNTWHHLSKSTEFSRSVVICGRMAIISIFLFPSFTIMLRLFPILLSSRNTSKLSPINVVFFLHLTQLYSTINFLSLENILI